MLLQQPNAIKINLLIWKHSKDGKNRRILIITPILLIKLYQILKMFYLILKISKTKLNPIQQLQQVLYPIKSLKVTKKCLEDLISSSKNRLTVVSKPMESNYQLDPMKILISTITIQVTTLSKKICFLWMAAIRL